MQLLDYRDGRDDDDTGFLEIQIVEQVSEENIASSVVSPYAHGLMGNDLAHLPFNRSSTFLFSNTSDPQDKFEFTLGASGVAQGTGMYLPRKPGSVSRKWAAGSVASVPKPMTMSTLEPTKPQHRREYFEADSPSPEPFLQPPPAKAVPTLKSR